MSQLSHSVMGSVGTPASVVEKPNPLNDLRSLIEVGCIKDEVHIGGKVFSLKTMNSVDRVRLGSILKDNPTAEDYYDFRINVLAQAITNIDGKALELWHPDSEMDPLKRRIEILSMLQSPVINTLFTTYTDMLERCDAQFGLDQIKK